MRSLAAIAFSFAAAILSLCLLPVGHWVFWAAGILAAAGGVVLLLPRLRALGRLRVYLALITLSLAAGLLDLKYRWGYQVYLHWGEPLSRLLGLCALPLLYHLGWAMGRRTGEDGG